MQNECGKSCSPEPTMLLISFTLGTSFFPLAPQKCFVTIFKMSQEIINMDPFFSPHFIDLRIQELLDLQMLSQSFSWLLPGLSWSLIERKQVHRPASLPPTCAGERSLEWVVWNREYTNHIELSLHWDPHCFCLGSSSGQSIAAKSASF